MAEYIEREALLKVVSGWRILVKDLYDCGYDDCITAIEDTVSDAPAADVEPVRRGEWIIVHEHTYLADGTRKDWDNFFCSECYTPENAPRKFCAECGAKTGGEENAE